MPFKVVQTIEGNKFKLLTVPSGWENENILRYPNKYITKFIKDQNCAPMPHWDVMKCQVKRTNIQSYDMGEKLISEMLKHSDTEEEAYCLQPRRPENKKTLNLNSMAQDMVGNVLITDPNRNLPSSSSAGLPPELNLNVSYIEETQTNSTNTSHALSNDHQIPLEQDSVSFDIIKIFENQKNILDNQATIVSQILQIQQQQVDNNLAIMSQFQSLNNTLNSFIQKLSALSVQLEDAVSQIVLSPSQDVLTLSSSKNHIDNIPIHIKPIDNAHDLDDLEKQLSDPNNRDRLKNTYSFLCSGGKATDCAYMLVDVMFTRKFICECSWSGGSRGEDVKVPLKGYKHILSFFWSMVHSWDEKYSLKDNEMFFKTILKNAKKRKMAKLERASTSRCSKPKNIAKRVKFSEENAQNNACDYDESDNDLNERENAMENKEKNDSVQQNLEENKEMNDAIEENTEKNKKRYDLVKNNTDENDKTDDIFKKNMGKKRDRKHFVTENSKENEEKDDLEKGTCEENKKIDDSHEAIETVKIKSTPKDITNYHDSNVGKETSV